MKEKAGLATPARVGPPPLTAMLNRPTGIMLRPSSARGFSKSMLSQQGPLEHRIVQQGLQHSALAKEIWTCCELLASAQRTGVINAVETFLPQGFFRWQSYRRVALALRQ